MKILMFFAPAFIPLGKAFMKSVKAQNPDASFVALATTRRVVQKLEADKSVQFEAIECLEDHEAAWLSEPFSEDEMKKYEREIGAKNIQNMVVCDRHVGAGFVTCALPIHSKLYLETRDPQKLKSFTLGMVRYADEFFKTHKPDVLMAYVVASGPMLAFALMCERYNVPFVRLQHTRVESYMVLDTDIKGMLEPVWARYRRGDKPGKEALEKAKAWLEEYRGDSKDPDYMAFLKKRQKRDFSVQGLAMNVARAAVRFVAYDLIKGDKPLRSPSGWQGLVDSVMVPYKTWKIARQCDYVSLEEAQKSPYIYFPLHVDPEASTMLLSPDYTNQLTVIEAIAKNMPAHMRLLVKEHPNMNGKRPNGFYERIESFPGVRLFDPAVTGAQALKYCALTVTITGTSGWEAVLNGNRAVVLGDAHFRQFETAITHCQNLAHLSEDIEQALQQKTLSDAELIRFMGVLFEESMVLPTSLMWGTEGQDQIDEKDQSAVDELVSHFQRRMDTALNPGQQAHAKTA